MKLSLLYEEITKSYNRPMKGWLSPSGLLYIVGGEHYDDMGPVEQYSSKTTQKNLMNVLKNLRLKRGDPIDDIENLSQYADHTNRIRRSENAPYDYETWFYSDVVTAAMSVGFVRVAWPGQNNFNIEILDIAKEIGLNAFKILLQNSWVAWTSTKDTILVQITGANSRQVESFYLKTKEFIDGKTIAISA